MSVCLLVFFRSSVLHLKKPAFSPALLAESTSTAVIIAFLFFIVNSNFTLWSLGALPLKPCQRDFIPLETHTPSANMPTVFYTYRRFRLHARRKRRFFAPDCMKLTDDFL